jgi:hypothetical protein
MNKKILQKERCDSGHAVFYQEERTFTTEARRGTLKRPHCREARHLPLGGRINRRRRRRRRRREA